MMFFTNPRIHNALYFATQKHASQYRKGTQKCYVVHPIAVSGIVFETMLKYDAVDENVFIAAILHDCLEDTDATPDEIESNFGEDVLRLIQFASEPDKTLSWKERKTETIEKIDKMELRALLVPLADKIHNLSEVAQDLIAFGRSADYWLKYNAGVEDQKWYHGSLITEMRRRLEREEMNSSAVCKMVQMLVDVYEEVYKRVFEM